MTETHTYTFNRTYADRRSAGEDLDRRVRRFMIDNPRRSYEAAMAEVLRVDADLKAAYADAPVEAEG